MDTNVLLIQPKVETIYKTVNFPPMGLSYIASVLRQNNVNVRVLDMRLEKYNMDTLKRTIQKDRPDIVGISSTTFGFNEAIRLSHFVKIISGCVTVIGGHHASLMPEEASKYFDYVVIGEGEETFFELVRTIDMNGDISKVKGMAYNGNVTESRPYIQDIDEIPYPAYDLFPLKKYKLKILPILTSRGCLYNCIYCTASKTLGKGFRPRSPESVIEEIKFMKKTYGINRFDILDDNFSMIPQRVEEICRKIIDEKIGIKWMCGQGIRADKINYSLLYLMKEAGCDMIAIGVESASDKILESLKKHESIEVIRKAFLDAKKVGIRTKGFFMIGSPDETFSDFLKSIQFFKDVKIDYPRFILITPYPKTELEEWVKKNATSIPDFDIMTQATIGQVGVAYETPYFTKEEKIRAYEYAQEEAEKWIIKNRVGDMMYYFLKPKMFRNILKYIYSKYLYPRGY